MISCKKVDKRSTKRTADVTTIKDAKIGHQQINADPKKVTLNMVVSLTEEIKDVFVSVCERERGGGREKRNRERKYVSKERQRETLSVCVCVCVCVCV